MQLFQLVIHSYLLQDRIVEPSIASKQTTAKRFLRETSYRENLNPSTGEVSYFLFSSQVHSLDSTKTDDPAESLEGTKDLSCLLQNSDLNFPPNLILKYRIRTLFNELFLNNLF